MSIANEDDFTHYFNACARLTQKLARIQAVCERWDGDELDACEAMALIEYELDKTVVVG